MPRVFVSGATGFIGGAITSRLAAENFFVLGGVRRAAELISGVAPLITGDLAAPGLTLPPVDAVVHAAGLGHRRGVPEAEWRAANLTAATNLATAAKAAGAQRFVLISTAHIHGRTHEDAVTDTSPAAPADDYAASKLAAEAEVAQIFGPGLTILRPVAVIGPGCPGNIPLLMKALRTGVPLPFAAINNRRSFIHVDDLAALVLAALAADTPPDVALAAHPEAISTPQLIRALAAGIGVPARLFPCPGLLMALGAKALGRGAMWQGLSGSFPARPAAALSLGWKPAKSLAVQLEETARYYNTTRQTP